MLEGGGGGGGGGSGVPTGTVVAYVGATAPAGWLFCFGQAVSRTTYSALLAVIGGAFGAGDLTTTFNVPDLRGRVPLGRDNMGGTPANRVTAAQSGVSASDLGAIGGSQLLHGHSHGITDPGHTHSTTGNFATDTGAEEVAAFGVGLGSGSGVNTATTGISVNTAGAGSSQNIPPVQVLNYIIKT